MNIKYHCEAGGETGYHAHSKAFWSRLQKYNDGSGIPINIVLDTSNHPIFYKEYHGIKICYNVMNLPCNQKNFLTIFLIIGSISGVPLSGRDSVLLIRDFRQIELWWFQKV